MATEIARTVVTDTASLIATAPGSLNEGEVYSVSVQNQGEGTVTLGDETVTAGAGRVDVDPDGADVGRVTLAAGEELWAITDGDPATIFGTAGVLAGQTPLVADGGGGALTFGTATSRIGESGMAAALANGDNIAALDVTKSRIVQVRFSNLAGSTKSPFIVESVDGNLRDTLPIPNTLTAMLKLWLAPGEEFWASLDGCDVDDFVERAVS